MTSGAALLAPSYREACYWLEGVQVPGPFEDRPLPPSADVVVVGGGYTGIAAAHEVARRGTHAVVLERHRLGWGASTRNGGMVLPDVKHHGVAELRARFGEAGPALYRATVDAVLEVERFASEPGVDCGYERTGHLYLAHCPSRLGELRAKERVYREDLGLEARLLGRDQLRDEIGSTVHAGGLLVELSGGLHPAKHFAALAGRAVDAGVQVHERTPAVRIERRPGGGALVVTPRGDVEARDVLVATDGYTDGVAPRLRRRLIPVGSFIIATEPLDPSLARELSPRGRMFFDTKNFLFYWRLSPDGTRMLFGGRASFAPTTVARARDFLYRGMLRVHPQLEGVGVEYAWGGLVGLTRDRTPRLGRIDGITYALGYSGTGVAASAYLGRRAAAWLCGDDPPPFADLPFPPIPLARLQPAWLPVAGLWFKWQDRCPGARN
ncbi:MAG: FAD-binding oxidoreductase [Actinomycetota bacterium]|nr:FAD-binding oxidoreductase [Actinomycetota bacterium]